MVYNRDMLTPLGSKSNMWGIGSSKVADVFSPLDLSPVLWLDASDISTLFQDAGKTTPVTSDGDVVGAWVDKSGFSNDELQGITAKKPLHKTPVQNGLSVIRFDGADDFMQSLFVLDQPFSFYIAFNQITWSLALRVLGGGTLTALLFQRTNPPNELSLFANITAVFNSDLPVNTFGLASVLVNGALSTLQIDDGAKATGNPGPGSAGGITLASANNGAANGNIDIGELVVFDSALSAGNETLLQSYMNNKWNFL